MTSFKQLIRNIELFANSNKFINRFGVGPAEEINMNVPNSGKYPYLWIIPQQVTLLDNAVTYRFRFLVFDKDDSVDGLRIQKQNDTLATMIDIKTYLLQNIAGDEYEVSPSIQIFPFQQEWVDYCTGWYMDIDITTDATNNPCREIS